MLRSQAPEHAVAEQHNAEWHSSWHAAGLMLLANSVALHKYLAWPPCVRPEAAFAQDSSCVKSLAGSDTSFLVVPAACRIKGMTWHQLLPHGGSGRPTKRASLLRSVWSCCSSRLHCRPSRQRCAYGAVALRVFAIAKGSTDLWWSMFEVRLPMRVVHSESAPQSN